MKEFRSAVLMLALIMALGGASGCQAPPPADLPVLGAQQSTTAPVSDDAYLPLEGVASGTPERFEFAFAEPNYGWNIDAKVILPQDMERFDVIACGIGDEPDLDAMLSSELIPPELQQAETKQDTTIDFVNETSIPTHRKSVMSAPKLVPGTASKELYEQIVMSAHCAQGWFSYSHDVPDEYCVYQPSLHDGFDKEWGILSNDLVADRSGLTAAEAEAMALAFLDALPLPFEYTAGQITAFSATDETERSHGYYQLQIQQLMDGKPASVFNISPVSPTMDLDPRYIPHQVGATMRVFDYGVETAELYWLSDSFEVVRPVDKLISLPQAAQIMADFFEEVNAPGALEEHGMIRDTGEYYGMIIRDTDKYPLMAFSDWFNGLDIHTIRLEYAVVGRKDDKLVLSPCWSFEGAGKWSMQNYYGFRVDALTGDLLGVKGGGY